MEPSERPVRYTIDDAVAVILLDSPRRRNSLDAEVLGLLAEYLGRAVRDRARVVVLRAAPGQSVWCAGFDIGSLRPGADPLAQDGALQGVFRLVGDVPIPVIAMVHGTAWGGGTDLALRCDIAVADPTCTLAFTPARLGLPYDPDGLLNVLMRGGLGVAMEMFATADPIPAARALALGLVNHVVPEGELEAFTMGMAARIAENAPLSVASAKRQLRALNAAMPVPGGVMQALLESRRAALESADYAEGLAAFAGKRRPRFEGR